MRLFSLVVVSLLVLFAPPLGAQEEQKERSL